jgi:hypothetical protein
MFNPGDTFYTKDNRKGKVLRLAAIDEFGSDFHYEEINYVVEFENNTWCQLPLATYNIIINGKHGYAYIMNIEDMHTK